MHNKSNIPARPGPRLRVGLILSFLAVPLVGYAQHEEGPEIPRFAETWRSSGGVQGGKQPYAPIKATHDQGQIPEIDMFVGETRVFPAPRVARIAVGNGQIMSAASLDDKEVIVFANAVGTSSLFIWNENGSYQRVKINIVPGDTSRFAREIAAFLSAIPQAKASVIGDKVIVEGDDLSDRDLAKIDELAKRYPQVVNFTDRLGWDQMVLMDVKVVEFPTNELREIGLKWGATGGVAVGGVWAPIAHGKYLSDYQINLATGSDNAAPISAAGGGTSVPLHRELNLLSVVNMGLNAQLALLSQEGKASILAEPQLSARNGAKATFLAGGEYPYTVTTLAGPTVMFKPYGVKLEIVPQVTRNGTIRATIDSEVSAIDTSIATIAGPALSSRRTSTEFNVRNGETLVLAGLLTRKNSVSIDKVPFLGDIPILGALFRSKRFQNDETELVVFVTPRIVDSRSPGLVDRVEKVTRRLEEDLGRAPYLNEADQPMPAPVQTGQLSPTSPELESGESRPRLMSPARAPVEEAVTPQDEAPLGVEVGAVTAPDVVTINQRVIREGVPVHALPNRSSPLLDRLDRGTVLAAGEAETVGGWRQVRLADGTAGWIGEQSIAPTTESVNIVRADTEATAAVGATDKGVGRDVSGRIAAHPVTPLPDPEGVPGQSYRITGMQLALRVSPDVNAQRLAWLAPGTEVDALSKAPVAGWIPVQSGLQRGWVWARSLQPINAEEP